MLIPTQATKSADMQIKELIYQVYFKEIFIRFLKIEFIIVRRGFSE